MRIHGTFKATIYNVNVHVHVHVHMLDLCCVRRKEYQDAVRVIGIGIAGSFAPLPPPVSVSFHHFMKADRRAKEPGTLYAILIRVHIYYPGFLLIYVFCLQ